MLVGCIFLYLALSIGVGLYAATRVRGAADFALAGGRFGTTVVSATVFATWFGAEAVLGIPATFLKEGLRGLIADPFAAVACLALVGFVFARPFFRMDALTLGDYFRARYNRASEVALTLSIAFSYLGWIAAQFVALGLAFNVLSAGAIDTRTGIVVGALAVLLYTMAGGMWSVALTDFLQALLIIAGLGYCAWVVADLAGGAPRVLEVATAGGRMRFLPEADAGSVLAWISAGLVVALGSVPQQDVFQRVRSSRDEATAVRSSILGGLVYFTVAAIPISLACAALAIDPAGVERVAAEDPQLILPTLILERTPLAVQVLFFGALISAILSTAGGALLAPAVTLAENIVRPWVKQKDDRALLATMRFTLAGLAMAVLAMALTSRLSIYQLVNESGKVVLVTSFVPLAAGIFWRRANARGALAAIACGLAAWLGAEALDPQGVFPPALVGFGASLAGMLGGSLSSWGRPSRLPDAPETHG